MGHRGHDHMLAETCKKFANVTKKFLYLPMCDVCQEKENKEKEGVTFKGRPTVSNEQ